MNRSADPQPVISYASRAEPNRDATVALVWGVLCVVPLVVPGVLAIRYGRAGVRRASATGTGKGKARAGVVLGIAGLIWSAVVLVSAPYAYIRAREKAEAVACAAHLRQIGMGCIMYASANRGWLPPNLAAIGWMGVGPIRTCPAAARSSATPPPYVLVPLSVRLAAIKSPATTVLAYEPLSNHGGRGINVLFVDGHVAWYPAAAATPLIAAMTASAPTTAPSGR